MIRLLQKGYYKLINTNFSKNILVLGSRSFTMDEENKIREFIFATLKSDSTYQLIEENYYRLYKVINEGYFEDGTHLELHLGEGVWRGYLLPKGLPHRAGGKWKNILPTKEVITKAIC